MKVLHTAPKNDFNDIRPMKYFQAIPEINQVENVLSLKETYMRMKDNIQVKKIWKQ